MARVEQSIEILARVHDVYEQLTQCEQFPSFIEGVQQVQRLDSEQLHWKIRTGGLDMEWDTETTVQVPDRSIGWRTVREPHCEARVELEPMAPERTRVKLAIEYDPRHELVMQYGDAQAVINRQVENDLARFKTFMETLPHRHAAWQSRPNDPRTESAQAQSGAQAREKYNEQAQAQRDEASASAAAGSSQEESPHPPWFSNFIQAWGEPLNIMRRMSEEMDQLIDRFLARSPYPKTHSEPASEWIPAVEIAQTEDKLVICAELPGVKKDDVHVEVKNDRITIEGDRRPPQESAASQQLHRSERSYGHFYRVITLPEGAEPQSASAAMHDGVLEIVVPVPEGGKRGRRIDIHAQ